MLVRRPIYQYVDTSTRLPVYVPQFLKSKLMYYMCFVFAEVAAIVKHKGSQLIPISTKK